MGIRRRMADDKPIVIAFEDDRRVGETYEEIVTDLGGDIVVTASGENGIALIRQLKPRLVLLDIMLEGPTNGFDILEQLKRDPELSTIPVVMMTNLDSEEQTALNIGANEYLVKANTSLTDLEATIKSYLQ